MIWWTQIIVAACFAASFDRLKVSYRRQDAQQNMFLLSILLGIAALFVPETWLIIPFTWGALSALRAYNFKAVMASIMGAMTVVIYSGIVWFVWPDSTPVEFVQSIYNDSLCRLFGWWTGPLWQTLVMSVLMLFSIVYQLAHLSRFSSANVRVQTRFLLAVPIYWLTFLSCLFPSCTGNCLLLANWISACYLVYLFVANYGLPSVRSLLPQHTTSRHARSFSRRNSHPANKRLSWFHRASSPQTRSFSRRNSRRAEPKHSWFHHDQSLHNRSFSKNSRRRGRI